ncbi:MAG TPA: diaminopimelate epimerase, partial [Chloroflexota bacterium]|nr:diaminopimelate epimerase [Chloroflexota bacterium]
GLLLVRASECADVRMLIWNPDGSESEMCGNGIRCFARYVLDGADEVSVETGAGILKVRRHALGFQATMGQPRLAPAAIPVLADAEPVLDLPLPGLDVVVTCVGMGNPHAVQFVPDMASVDLAALGPRVEHHPLFPHRVNFHLCQVVSRTELVMRSWERGAGLTLACGTGAAATAVAARLQGRTDEVVTVRVPGGELEVSWDGRGDALMAGPAEPVFQGEWPRL